MEFKINKKKSSKKTVIKNQKGGETPLITGFTEKGPMGIEVGTKGSPIITVNNALATAYQIPVAVFKTLDFIVGTIALPADLGHTFTMDNGPETTNLNLVGGKKNHRVAK